ncbi:MAG: alpha-2-macroglobulin family protein [Paracoccaceae bacterium]
MHRFLSFLLIALCLSAVQVGAQDNPIAARRLALSKDIDLPGGDLQTIFDTTLDACERACLADNRCLAFTFNGRAGACFPKSVAGVPAPYEGALSGRVLPADPAALAAAPARRAELTFLSDRDIAQARDLAGGLANLHVSGEWTADQHRQTAANAEAGGNAALAASLTGAALNLSDAPEDWADYARLNLAAAEADNQNRGTYRERAFAAAVNAYLRTSNAALKATVLTDMARALENLGRGRDMIPALRLAQASQFRDDTEALLDDAIGKYGFRIVEHQVDSDSAFPRICASFSDALVKSGVDYSAFVRLPEPGLAVTAEGSQLCVEGVAHGARYAVTFREGLPAASGEAMAKSVTLNLYVRDRSAAVRFPGRAYVLPRGTGAAIPVETVNTGGLELTLRRVSDRNILRAIQDDYFGQPLSSYQTEYFASDVAEEVWKGSAEVAMEVNRDMTTRLPMDEAIAGQPPGIYALEARVPGADPYEVASATQWFVISDLGLTTLSGVDGVHVFVRSLGGAAAKSGVKLTLLSRSNRPLGSAVTDDQGHAMFAGALAQGTGGAEPALVLAEDGADDMAFLSLSDPEFDLSDRGVEGREAAPPIDVFLATDRGAYRAGETLHATILARDGASAAIEGLPLTVVARRPDGVEHSRLLAADLGAGGHVIDLPLAASAPRGIWRLEVFADPDAPTLATQTFLVEDFLPERIDFDLTLGDGPVHLGDQPVLGIAARYLFGAPGADLAIEGEVVLRAADGLEAYPGYVFGRHDEPFETRMEPLPYGEATDAEGQASLPVTLPAVEDPGRPLLAELTVRLAEGSGRPVERRLQTRLVPSDPVLGIRPEFDGVAPEGGEAAFRLIAVGPEETPVAATVRWTVNRVETRYQWYQLYGNWNWEPVTRRSRVAQGEATLGGDAVRVAAPVEWGEYELVVERIDGPVASASTLFYAGWYASADASATPDVLEMSLDKPAYVPGETAHLRMVPRAAGTALVTMLSNRLIAMQAVEVSEGENRIDLPVTDDWGPGVYVTVSALRPMDVAAGRNPARALGLAYAAVDPGNRRLGVALDMAEEAEPRGPLDLTLKVEGVAPGETAFATVAAVDLGILNLTAYQAPDPEGHYFGQRKLGVGIRDLYGRLIDGMNGAIGTVRSGGDAGAQARLQAPPPTEELVAYFSGPVTVGADGKAHVRFDLPAFNGTVRVMAVAWSKTGIGQASGDVLVRDPVVVTASLPRFMAPGDESRLLLEIVHARGPAGRVGLDVSGDGVTLGAVPSGVDLAEGGKAVVAVPVTAGEAGIHSLTVALTTPDGRVLVKPLALPVEVNDPPVVSTRRFDLASGGTFAFSRDVFAGYQPGTGSATLAVGPLARFDAPGLLQALDSYPYGCTEQLTSRAMPLLYFDSVAEAMDLDTREGLHQRVSEALVEILQNQSAEGSFGLWRPGNGDLWLDAYVTDFLSRAKARGYDVPALAFRQALDNLRNQVNYAPDFDAGGGPYAYALMVLAREGAAAIGDLRYYADVKAEAFNTPIAAAQLGAALAAYGDQRRADRMFAEAVRQIDELPAEDSMQLLRTDYGTNRRDAAAVLALATEAGSNAIDAEALAERIARAGSARRSTQEAVWTLMATEALIDRAGVSGFTVNGSAVSGPLVRLMADEAEAAAIDIANGSGSDALLTLTTTGVPATPEPAGGNGYAIRRSYYTLSGEPADIASVAIGTRLVAVLEVEGFTAAEARLMIDDPLPAGFEIDNPNLISGDAGDLGWLDLSGDTQNVEFRQNRFLAAVDLYGPATVRLGYKLRAVSPGRFHHPAASVEDMYRPDNRAWTDTATVAITE